MDTRANFLIYCTRCKCETWAIKREGPAVTQRGRWDHRVNFQGWWNECTECKRRYETMPPAPAEVRRLRELERLGQTRLDDYLNEQAAVGRVPRPGGLLSVLDDLD